MNALAVVEKHKVFGVIRTATAEQAVACARAAIEGGIRLIEVTLTIPGWPGVFAALRGVPDALVGAGSVIDAEMARAAIAAGARFVVAPNTDPAIVGLCKGQGIFVSTGALTPTEVVNAWRAGVDIVKVFPASSVGGPAHLRALKEPLPFIRLMPTGGVNLENVADYFRAGATAVGVAGSLFPQAAIERGEYGAVTANARRFVEVLASL